MTFMKENLPDFSQLLLFCSNYILLIKIYLQKEIYFPLLIKGSSVHACISTITVREALMFPSHKSV